MKVSSALVLSLLCAMVTLTLSGCAPVKGYVGPELPPSQVSNINLSYDSNSIDVNDANIDGTHFGYSGIDVLPGSHNFDLDITVKQPPDHCYAYPQMDYYGYNKCRKKNQYCDCYSYLKVYQKCYRQVQDGSCHGSFKSAPGGKYHVSVTRSGTNAYVRVGGADSGSDGNCSTAGSRTVTEDNYVGSGRYDANRYGVYGCY